MNITIIGTGYVGLVAGACFADMGNNVICVDNDAKKLEQLKNGIIPIYEPGLSELVLGNYSEKRLMFSTDIAASVKSSKVCFIAVGTPQGEDGSADLKYVYNVAEEIGKAIDEYKVIVNKSTVPVGTAENINKIIQQYTHEEFDIVSNPEFLKQGNAVEDFLKPDRIIIGTQSQRAIEIMKEIYSPFLLASNKLIFMDNKSAELTKYAANSFLATKISFMNEIANLCEKVGADSDMVRIGMASDQRIGNKFLFPGIGYGGSCFPKDVKALINTGHEYDVDMLIMKAVNEVNKNQRNKFVQKIVKYFGDIKGKTFAVWGLSFKPKTNDMREAPSITIINSLLQQGAKIQAYDPKAIETAKLYLGDKIIYTENAYAALKSADALLLLTEWNEFRRPNFSKMKELLKNPLIFDGRNQYNKKILTEYGFTYFDVGRCTNV